MARVGWGPARQGALAVVVVALVALVAGCAQDLGVNPGGGTSRAHDVNASGWVVGSKTFGDGTTGAFKHRDGVPPAPMVLPPGYRSAAARAINDDGLIVGTASQPIDASSPSTAAVYWDTSNQAHLMTGRGGPSTAVDVNSSGMIVGVAAVAEPSGPLPASGPVVWPTPTSAPIPLSTIASNFGGAWATAINDAGTVIGYQTTNFEDSHALSWSGPSFTRTDLAPSEALNEVIPLAINSSGDVVGVWGSPGIIDPSSGLSRPMIIPAGGALRLLPGLAGQRAGTARAIADDGTIVGDAIANGQTHAARWSPGAAEPVDLGTIDGRDSSAWSINASGMIVGWSLNDADGPGQRAAFFTG